MTNQKQGTPFITCFIVVCIIILSVLGAFAIVFTVVESSKYNSISTPISTPNSILIREYGYCTQAKEWQVCNGQNEYIEIFSAVIVNNDTNIGFTYTTSLGDYIKYTGYADPLPLMPFQFGDNVTYLVNYKGQVSNVKYFGGNV